jgi:serine O-acetyltransferase
MTFIRIFVPGATAFYATAPVQSTHSHEGNAVATFDIAGIVQSLHTARQVWRTSQGRSNDSGGREFPSRDALAGIIESLKGVLFPMRLGPPDLRQESEDFHVAHALDAALHALLKQVRPTKRHWRPYAALPRRCRRSARCSTATCWRPTRAILPRAVSMKCCCAIPACWR